MTTTTKTTLLVGLLAAVLAAAMTLGAAPRQADVPTAPGPTQAAAAETGSPAAVAASQDCVTFPDRATICAWVDDQGAHAEVDLDPVHG
jgi:hypothetical protein